MQSRQTKECVICERPIKGIHDSGGLCIWEYIGKMSWQILEAEGRARDQGSCCTKESSGESSRLEVTVYKAMAVKMMQW